MDVDAALVTDGEPSKPVEPGEAALDHPSVSAEFLAGLDVSPGDPRLDLTAVTSMSAAAVIVSLVGVQLVQSTPWSPALGCYSRDGVEKVFEGHAVVDIRPGQEEGERDAATITVFAATRSE